MFASKMQGQPNLTMDFLAEPVKARGCSKNAALINGLTH